MWLYLLCLSPKRSKQTKMESLKSKIVQRKGSKTKWQVFGDTQDLIYLMSYNTTKHLSRMVKREVFNRDWRVL